MIKITLHGDPARAASWVPFARSKAKQFHQYLMAGGIKVFDLDSRGFIRLSGNGFRVHAHIEVQRGDEGYEFFFLKDRLADEGHYAYVRYVGTQFDVPQFASESVGSSELGLFLPAVPAKPKFLNFEHPLSPMIPAGTARRQGDVRLIGNRPRIPELMDVGFSFDYNDHDRAFPPGTGYSYYKPINYSTAFISQPWKGRYKSQVTTVGEGFIPMVVPDGAGGAFTVMTQYALKDGTADVDFYLPDTGVTHTVSLPAWMGASLTGNYYINWKMNDDGTRIAGVMGPRTFFWNIGTDSAVEAGNGDDRRKTHNYGYVEFIFSGSLHPTTGLPVLSVTLGRNEQNHGCVFDVDYPWGSDDLRIIRSAYKVGGWIQGPNNDLAMMDQVLRIAVRAEWIDIPISGIVPAAYRTETLYHGYYARVVKGVTEVEVPVGGIFGPGLADGAESPLFPIYTLPEGDYYLRATLPAFEQGAEDIHGFIKEYGHPYHYIHRRFVALDLKSDSYCLRRQELHPCDAVFDTDLLFEPGYAGDYWSSHHFSREHRFWGDTPVVEQAGAFTLKTLEDVTTGYEEYAPGHELWVDGLLFANFTPSGLSDILRLCFPEPYYDYQIGDWSHRNMYYRDWGFIVSQPKGNIAAYVPALPFYYGTQAGIVGYPDLDLINFAYLDEQGTMQFKSTSHADVIQQLWPTLGTITADDVDLIAASGVWGSKP